MRALLLIFLTFSLSAHAGGDYPILLCVGPMRGSEAKSQKACEKKEKGKKGTFQECMKDEARKQGKDYGLLRINGNHVVGPDIAVGLKRTKYSFQTRGQSIVIDFTKKKAKSFCAFFTSHGGLALDPCQCKLPVTENF